MTTAVELLSAVSGLGKADVEALVAKVQANKARLDGCAGPHAFLITTGTSLRAKYGCTLCGGEVGAVEHAWYERGLLHARRPPR